MPNINCPYMLEKLFPGKFLKDLTLLLAGGPRRSILPVAHAAYPKRRKDLAQLAQPKRSFRRNRQWL